MVLIIRLARSTDFYVLSFLPLPFSTSRSGLYPHIPPLFSSSSVTVFSQPPPALRIQMGVIFVIGVNELVFFAQGRT
jgi:hypothetical protein